MTNETEIGQRLDAFRKHLGLTQEVFAQSIRIKKGFLNEVIHGRKGIGAKIIINIAIAYQNLNLRWLLLGQGGMYMLETIYENAPPELESGQPNKVEEGVKIEYLKPEMRLDAMQARLDDHERRLRKLEKL